MKIGVLTGGGDCPGLNPAIRGIVYRSMDYRYEVVGINNGWEGLLELETEPLNIEKVDEIIGKGGTILGTSRVNPFKKEGGPEKVIQNIKKLGLDGLIAIGGEDTLGVAFKFFDMGVKIVGVPKTMDNDLSETDFTFGFDTSVTIAVEALERLRDTAFSHRRIIVLEVMGRHAGWVALYTALAGGADWVLIPEEKLDLEAMFKHLKEDFERKKYALVVVSEGIDIPGIQEEKLDEFGHMLLQKRGVGDYIANLIESKTGIPTRSAVIGHIQRGGPPTVFDRVLGTRVGVKAVDMVKNKEFGMMAALRGNLVVTAPLKDAVGKLKTVDKDWADFIKIFYK